VTPPQDDGRLRRSLGARGCRRNTGARDRRGDPVEFAETFAQAYTGAQWIDKERARLTKAIDEAARAEEAR
jgi:hypothetical protein